MTSHRRLAICVGLLVAACSGGGNSAQPAATTVPDPTATSAPDPGAPTDPGDPATIEVGSDPVAAEARSLAQEVLDECAALSGEEVSRLTSEDLTDHVFSGQPVGGGTGAPLRCGDFSGADLEGAIIGSALTDDVVLDDPSRVDVSGASFQGANLRSARLSITAIGADFSGADLTGADFTDSDLRGANFTGAILVGSTMTSFEDGLASALLDDTLLGCNVLRLGPGVSLIGARIESDCATAPAFYNSMTLGGRLDGSIMPGFDFSSVVVEARSFRGVDLSGASLADKGVWPDGSDFSGAQLVGADLSGTGFHEGSFAGADLTRAVMDGTVWIDVEADGAILDQASLREAVLRRVALSQGSAVGADLTEAELERVDLNGTDTSGIGRSGLLIERVVCPSGVESVDDAGRCDFSMIAQLVPDQQGAGGQGAEGADNQESANQ